MLLILLLIIQYAFISSNETEETTTEIIIITPPLETVVTSFIEEDSDIARRVSEILDSYDCGKRASAAKINTNGTKNIEIDGNDNDSKEWPWVVSIYSKDLHYGDGEQLIGSASIITTKHLLSVSIVETSNNISSYKKPSSLFAIVGGERGFRYSIESIFIHPGTKGDDPLYGGIAVILLTNAITFSDFVRPVCLPSDHERFDNFQNQTLTVVDWIFSPNNFSSTKELKETSIQMQPEEFCQQFVRGAYPIHELMCAKAMKDEISCEFNDGAPIMTQKDGKFIAVGITDLGIGVKLPCEGPGAPVYFIKTAPYMKWITKIVYETMFGSNV